MGVRKWLRYHHCFCQREKQRAFSCLRPLLCCFESPLQETSLKVRDGAAVGGGGRGEDERGGVTLSAPADPSFSSPFTFLPSSYVFFLQEDQRLECVPDKRLRVSNCSFGHPRGVFPVSNASRLLEYTFMCLHCPQEVQEG